MTSWILHASLLCPPLAPGVCYNSLSSNPWCYIIISSSAASFACCLQYFLASRSFPMNRFFPSCGQHIGAPTSASVLPMNTGDWFLLGFNGLISLQVKELSRVFCNTRIQKHWFFGTNPSLCTNSHISTRLFEKTDFTIQTFVGKVAKGCLCFVICCQNLS